MQSAFYQNTVMPTRVLFMKTGSHSLLNIALLLIILTGPLMLKAMDTSNTVSGDLIIFHAGSLSVPFKQISVAFQRKYPLVRVKSEAAGSRVCARKISELGKSCDVFASADISVIDTLLIPRHAAWSIPFAVNELSIVYHKTSRHAGEITTGNWYRILMKSDVRFGRSDPNSDPCGYRAVLTIKLAESFYQQKDLAAEMLKKDTRYIRPKETDLLALLEEGEIDYIFLYRSVAGQHDLKALLLPDSINLKNPACNAVYSSASVDVSGTAPGTTITKKGEAIVYGVTIPTGAPNSRAALAFMKFLLDPENGMKIMAKNGQDSIVPSPTSTYEHIPPELKPFVKPWPKPATPEDSAR